MTDSIPEATASSTTYFINDSATTESISFGEALVAGRKRVPRPAAGKTALRTLCGIIVAVSHIIVLRIETNADRSVEVKLRWARHLSRSVDILSASGQGPLSLPHENPLDQSVRAARSGGQYVRAPLLL